MIINTKNKLSNSIILLCLIFLIGCTVKEQHYYYCYIGNHTNEIEFYIIKKVQGSLIRTEVDSYYSLDGEFRNKSGGKFKVYNNKLIKYNLPNNDTLCKLYLTTTSHECIDFLYDDVTLNTFASTRFCFLGQKDVQIKGEVYKNAYMFNVYHGSVESLEYYDEKFLLIMAEYVSGERGYYRIERLQSIPNVLQNIN